MLSTTAREQRTDPAALRPGARLVLALASAGWMSFWFWAFSLAFSDSFFQYNRHSRVPPFLAAWVASGLIPLCAWIQWRARRRSFIGAVLRQAAGVALSLSLPLLVTSTLARAPEPWRLSGDDAMGVGMDLLMLGGLGIASIGALATGLALRRLVRARGRVP